MSTLTVTPLGISAGTPTRDRNVASFLIELDGSALLFDCGEGAQQKLMANGWKPNALDAILITHLHGDHLFGLPGLLSTMSMLNREAPLIVAGPVGLAGYLTCIRSTSQLTLGYPLEVREIGDGEVLVNERVRVDAILLDHCIPCYGFSVTEHDRRGKFSVARARELGVTEGPLFGALQRGEAVVLDDGRRILPQEVLGATRRGRKVTYCTDTRMCDAAVQIARGSDLFIHEATYADEMEREAGERFHATARQAAFVATRAGVRQLMITHFSPRYADPEELAAEARSVFPDTIAARELEAVTVEFPSEEGL